VRLRILVPPEAWHGLTDANQLENAILNLAINARDAMPEGGVLTIEATNVVLDQRRVQADTVLEPGEYVAISVADTGSGMPKAVLEKAFDPFFTTKPVGQGTGLGLSMVYGFVHQCGGHVDIESAPGVGTTVRLTLPRAFAEAAMTASPAADIPSGTGETVMVIEDDPAVRMLVLAVLQELGYRTIEARDAATALPILASAPAIDLLISDVGLPGLNGRQIADYARVRLPTLKVLFVTGYAEQAATRSGFLAPGMAMITKPFAIETLAAKIREMMAQA
jgi:CheY-like chemotaxis protein